MEDKNYLEKSYANEEEINKEIQQFVYATNRYIYHLIESKDHEGWEQRLEPKRNDITAEGTRFAIRLYARRKRNSSVPPWGLNEFTLAYA